MAAMSMPTVGARTASWARLCGRMVNKILTPMNVRLTVSRPLDLRAITDDAIEATYRAGGRPLVIGVPLDDCRFQCTAFSGVLERSNPFVETLLAYQRGDCAAYEKSPLHRYYDLWQPMNAAEVVGLNGQDAHPALRAAPPIGAVMPWESWQPDVIASVRAGLIEEDNRNQGIRLPHTHGWHLCGPVSIEKGRVEFMRFTRIYDSIRRHGYRRRAWDPDGEIGGIILSRGGVSRFLVRPGVHRFTALASLSIDYIPMRLHPIVVRRDDNFSWPNVRKGLFSPQQATDIFDRIFEGRSIMPIPKPGGS